MAYDCDQIHAPMVSSLSCVTRLCWMAWCYKCEQILTLKKEDSCEEIMNGYSATRI